MKVKAMSLLVILALCLCLIPALSGSVTANPMETLHVTFGEPNFIQVGNSRSFTPSVSERIIQFTKPNLIVGNNASGSFYAASKMSWPVSGDLTGNVTADYNLVLLTWDGSPFSKGYGINTITFDDGYSNTFSGIMLVDIDLNPANPGGGGRIFSTSGTGTFYGKRLIGTIPAFSDGTMTATLRCYSGSEISPPQAFSYAGTVSLGVGGTLGASTGPLAYDELVQFSGANVSVPKTNPAAYSSGLNIDGSVTGSLSGTLSQSLNVCTLFSGPIGPDTIAGGWVAGKFSYSSQNGTIAGIIIGDQSSGDEGYMFALKEAATGSYAGRDYYATTMAEAVGDPGDPTGVSLNGNLYTLTAAEGISTATGTGLATLVPSAGTMENLVAVSEASLPSEGKPPDVLFPHGFFEFRITGLADGQSVTLTITLPSAIPTYAQYWKYGPTPSDPTPHWYQIPMGSNNGDNVITITLKDGGDGDDDRTENGVIVDQGGPGWPQMRPSPVFPSVHVGVGAAIGAFILGYFVYRRLSLR